jgi:hypothetical protein
MADDYPGSEQHFQPYNHDLGGKELVRVTDQMPERIWVGCDERDYHPVFLSAEAAREHGWNDVDGASAPEYRRADLPPTRAELERLVRPLEWENFDAWTFWAETPMGTYRIEVRDDHAVILTFNKTVIRYVDEDGQDYGGWPSIERAQQASEPDHTRRVLAMLKGGG